MELGAEAIIIIEGKLLGPQRHTRKDIDGTLERGDQHPPEREQCNQDRKPQNQIDGQRADAIAESHSPISPLRRIRFTATPISTSRQARRLISMAMARPYWLNRKAVL